MSETCQEHRTCGYRVWIAECPQDWKPSKWSDLPPAARAIEPLGEELLTEERAGYLIEGFNRVMLCDADRVWAIAVPAELQYADPLTPGGDVSGAAISFAGRRFPKDRAPAADDPRGFSRPR